MNNQGKIALSEIIILIVGIIAFSWMVGLSLPSVSGSGTTPYLTNAPGVNVGGQVVQLIKQGYTSITSSSGQILLQKDNKFFQAVTYDNNNYLVEVTSSVGDMPQEYIGVTVDKHLVESAPKLDDILGANTQTIEQGGVASWLNKKFSGGFWEAGGAPSALVSGAQWALVAYGVGQMIGSFAGLDEKQTEAISYGMAAGFGAYRFLDTWKLSVEKFGNWNMAIGAAVGLLVYHMMYKDEKTEIVTFNCKPWDARTGGNDCHKCNEQGILHCSEYQCRALGQSCKLLNPGTGEEKCEWVHEHDVNPPIIKPSQDVLTEGYRYTPDNRVSPPDRGVMIERIGSDKCIEAFMPLSFGITTEDEQGIPKPAKCKIDILRKENYDDMEFYFGGSSLFKTEHQQIMSLPNPSAFADRELIIEAPGEYKLHVRCQNANGHSNIGTFVFSFCVEDGPDETPPMIVTTDLLNGMPIAHNRTSINLKAYINEPATCRWSRRDEAYDLMNNTMSCSTRPEEMNVQMLYECSTTLAGIKNREANDYYFRCKDLAENKMTQSYKFTIFGTEPLILDKAEPNERTIKDSTDVVKVTLTAETSAGFRNGESICFYSNTGEEKDYVQFLNSGGRWQHSQELWLGPGDYEYHIKCIDLGGNYDSKIINFEVDSDTSAPIIIRAYQEENYLKLITNEEATCVYDTRDCSYSFDDGSIIRTTENRNHFVEWDLRKSYYIKCEDGFGNRPAPNQCSFIARPFDIPKS
jgi:hypothetical protein